MRCVLDVRVDLLSRKLFVPLAADILRHRAWGLVRGTVLLDFLDMGPILLA